MSIKIKTWLPVFRGFYGNYYLPSDNDDIIQDDIDYIMSGESLGLDESLREDVIDAYDFLYNYSDEQENTAQVICEYIGNIITKHFPEITGVEFERLVSPRQYNYNNDSIDCIVTINDIDKLIDFINKRMNDIGWAGFLEQYNSYDGFMSYYPADIESWENKLHNLNEDSAHELGSFLNYIIANGSTIDYKECELLEYITEKVFVGDYICSSEIKAHLEENDLV